GARPRRPDRRHVPRPDHRHRSRRHRARAARPADGGSGGVSAPDTTHQPSEPEADDTSAARTRPSAGEVLRDIASGGPVRIFFAVVLSLVVGSLLIIFTDEDVLDTLGYFFARPGDFFAAAGRTAWEAVTALFR